MRDILFLFYFAFMGMIGIISYFFMIFLIILSYPIWKLAHWNSKEKFSDLL